jgi:hypothetical protein
MIGQLWRSYANSTWSGLLSSLNVQLWKTEDSWRLDHSYRRGHRRDIPCLVDATNVRAVNIYRAWSMR